MKKDVIAILKAFEQSSYRVDYLKKMDEKKKALEVVLDEEMEDTTPMSIHSLRRKMRVFITDIEAEAKEAFGKTE